MWVYLFFNICQFLIFTIWSSIKGAYLFKASWWINPLIIIKYTSLYFRVFVFLKSTLSDMIQSFQLFYDEYLCNRYFLFFYLKFFVLLYLKYTSFSWHKVKICIFIHPKNVYSWPLNNTGIKGAKLPHAVKNLYYLSPSKTQPTIDQISLTDNINSLLAHILYEYYIM